MPPALETLPLTDPQERGLPRARRLAHIFAAITALTYGLIVLGALVRAHGAGLACPDWPLCFGDFVPRFDLKVAFEWSHRVLAGSISLLFVGAAASALRDPVIRPALRNLIVVTACVLAVQIVLGALTVWQLLASWTVVSHLLTGNAFALALALTARALFRLDAPKPRTAAGRALRGVLTATGALLIAQMTLGGLVSSTYAGLACTEWPACNAGVYFPSFEGALGTHLLHRLCAYALAVAVLVSAWLGRAKASLQGLLRTAAILVVAQVAVGVANVVLRLPVEITGLHSALAALLVLTLGLALAEVWPKDRPA
jgi:cytochrome c oxidase assembly protein subunit 15